MPGDSKPLLSEQDDIAFVVEPDEVVRSALHFILDGRTETHSFASLDQALAKAADRKPNIVPLGIGLVRNDGETTLAELAMRLPSTRILIVANSVTDPIARAGLRWGAHGCSANRSALIPFAARSMRCSNAAKSPRS